VISLLCLVPASLAAQALKWEQGANSLDGGWRTHAGDQTAWAASDFDDSSWQLTTLGESHPPTPGKYDERWYRLRINLPADHPPLALLVIAGDGTYEVYWNGHLLPGARLRSAWGASRDPKARAMPIQGSGSGVLALRVRVPNSSLFHWAPTTIQVFLGTQDLIDYAARANQSEWLNRYVISWALDLLQALAAIALILLFLFQRDHREYLWMGLNLLFLANGGASLTPAMFVCVTLPAIYLSPITQIEFTFSFAGQPVTRIWRAYQGLLLLAVATLPALLWIGKIDFFPYQAVEASLLVPATFILPVLLFVWYRRGNREAGWLIVPSLLPLLSICIIDLGLLGLWLGLPWLAVLINRIPIGALSFWAPDPANLLYLLALGIVIFLRFNRVSLQQARAAQELEAAQRVQSLLLRAAHADSRWLRTEAVYRPAAEVGGDFFHIAQIEGLSRIVIGDVSGKGLGAAMLVSALIGALDADRNADPAAVLKQLNELLLARQQGGFATCLCAVLAPSGETAFANAGHFAPYLNGKEEDLANGLPLGIVADAEYPETTLELVPGDTLTMLTDGVVEARNKTGELFGFERAAAISTESAQNIAGAAQSFGQEDDITVLTVRYVPVLRTPTGALPEPTEAQA
jgi:phosphoserine phosphatase RsbU/P